MVLNLSIYLNFYIREKLNEKVKENLEEIFLIFIKDKWLVFLIYKWIRKEWEKFEFFRRKIDKRYE